MDLPESKNVLRFEGEIDLQVSPQIAAQLSALIKERPTRIIVDLSRVTYIDSSGLAVLVNAMQDVEEYDGRFVLSGLQDNVRHILESARLDKVLLSFPHVDAALAAT